MQTTGGALPHSLPYFNQDAWVTDLPDVEYKLALDCLRQGDVGHALFHIGQAIPRDPVKPQYIELVEQIAATSSDVLEHHQLAVDYIGVQFVRALLLASRGAFLDAISLAVRAAYSVGDHRYLQAARDWLGHTNSIDLDPISEMAGWLLARDSDLPYVQGQPSPLEDWLPFLDDVFASVRFYDEMFAFRYIVLKRLARQFSESVALAEEFAAVTPGYWSFLAAGNAHFSLGHVDAGFCYLNLAAQTKPLDEAIQNDLGDKYLRFDILEEARSAYAAAVTINPQSEWAVPSLVYVQLLITGEPQYLHSLRDLAQAGNSRAHYFMDKSWPYFDYLPEPPDVLIAGMKMIDQMNQETNGGQRFADGTGFVFEQGMPPCPSALLAVRRHIGKVAGDNPLIEWRESAEVTELMQEMKLTRKDYQRCTTDVRFALWNFADNPDSPPNPIVTPRFVEKSPAVCSAVHELAAKPYELRKWWQSAQDAMQQMKPGAALREHLLSSMSDPGAAPAGMPEWNWVYRWQIACALLLAAMELASKGTALDGALKDLALGIPDWSTSAASIALCAVYHYHDELTAEEKRAFGKEIDQIFVTASTRAAHVFSASDYARSCCHLTVPTNPGLIEPLRTAKASFEKDNWR